MALKCLRIDGYNKICNIVVEGLLINCPDNLSSKNPTNEVSVDAVVLCVAAEGLHEERNALDSGMLHEERRCVCRGRF